MIRTSGPSINDVMLEGGWGGKVCLINNVEGCIKMHDEGGGGLENAPR